MNTGSGGTSLHSRNRVSVPIRGHHSEHAYRAMKYKSTSLVDDGGRLDIAVLTKWLVEYDYLKPDEAVAPVRWAAEGAVFKP